MDYRRAFGGGDLLLDGWPVNYANLLNFVASVGNINDKHIKEIVECLKNSSLDESKLIEN